MERADLFDLSGLVPGTNLVLVSSGGFSEAQVVSVSPEDGVLVRFWVEGYSMRDDRYGIVRYKSVRGSFTKDYLWDGGIVRGHGFVINATLPESKEGQDKLKERVLSSSTQAPAPTRREIREIFEN